MTGYVYDDDPFVIHICKDKTFSIRERPDPIFNDAALPVISCRTHEEAKALQVATCAEQWEPHSQLPPGEPWYRLMSGDWNIFGPALLEVEELEPIADYLYEVLDRIRSHG